MGLNNKKEKLPGESVISREPFPNSEKIYVKGKVNDIKVAMREITTDDKISNENDYKLTVYDTSGPYTDPDIEIDVHKGLNPLRKEWIEKRNDTEPLDGFTSDYTNERLRAFPPGTT